MPNHNNGGHTLRTNDNFESRDIRPQGKRPANRREGREAALALSLLLIRPIFASRVARGDLGKQGKLGDQEI